MRLRLVPVIAAGLVALAPLGLAHISGDDAGRNADAPGAVPLSWDVPLGTLRGSLHGHSGDGDDCYRYSPGPLHYLDIILNDTTIPTSLWAYGDDGTSISNAQGLGVNQLIIQPKDPAARICVRSWWPYSQNGHVHYQLQAEAGELPDLELTSVLFVPSPDAITAGAFTVDPARHRETRVAGTNHGPGWGRGVDLVVYAEHGEHNSPHHSRRIIYEEQFVLPPGTSFERSFSWDSLGELGSGRLIAQVNSAVGDHEPLDNERIIPMHVVTPLPFGDGGDALNQVSSYGVNGLKVGPASTAWVEADHEETRFCAIARCVLAVPLGLP